MNNISSITPINNLDQINSKNVKKSDNEFNSLFSELINKTNQTDKNDKQQNINLMTGEIDNLHDALISAEEADLALRLTIQIRNKVIDAYNEVMRLQF